MWLLTDPLTIEQPGIRVRKPPENKGDIDGRFHPLGGDPSLALVFLVAMIAGMVIYELLERASAVRVKRAA